MVEYAIYGELKANMTSLNYDADHNGVADIMDKVLEECYTSHEQGYIQLETRAFEDTDGDGIDDQLEEDLWGDISQTSDMMHNSDGDSLADVIEFLLYGNLTSFSGEPLFPTAATPYGYINSVIYNYYDNSSHYLKDENSYTYIESSVSRDGATGNMLSAVGGYAHTLTKNYLATDGSNYSGVETNYIGGSANYVNGYVESATSGYGNSHRWNPTF